MDLIEQSKIALATVFAFYLKAHYFHWNVEGVMFPYLHAFFGDIYEGTFEEVDGLAEHIRTLGAYAPGSLSRFSALSKISDELNIPPADSMIQILKDDNGTVIDELTKTMKLADTAGKIGFSNYLQDRIDYHNKLAWMLRATVEN